MVRTSRHTPKRVSNLRMMWLSTDCVMPSLAAASVKLRSRATARTTIIWLILLRSVGAPGGVATSVVARAKTRGRNRYFMTPDVQEELLSRMLLQKLMQTQGSFAG